MAILVAGATILKTGAGLIKPTPNWRAAAITGWTNIEPDNTYYDAFGVWCDFPLALAWVARRGLYHVDNGVDGWGNVTQWRTTDGVNFTRTTLYTATNYDNRNNGGGMVPTTKTGLVWFARYHYSNNTWDRMICLRSTDAGLIWNQTVTNYVPGGLQVFSPYGPLVQLPSGKILAFFYGWTAGGTYYSYHCSSVNDGVTWDTTGVTIAGSAVWHPTETACVYIDGATDGASRLLAIVRNNGGRPHQLKSLDGGTTWTDMGILPFSPTTLEISGPWLYLHTDGLVYLAYDDQETKQIRLISGVPNDVLSDVNNWGTLGVLRDCDPGGDYGYTNLIPFNDDILAMCYDTPTGGNADPYLGLVSV